MAVQRFRARKARIRCEVRGRLSVPDTNAAVKRANEENSRLLQSTTRARAQGLVRHRDPESRHTNPMVEGYTSNVVEGGWGVSLFNRRQPRANLFEEGSPPHFIFARRGRYLKFANIPAQGGFGPFVYSPVVAHPGQRATHVMRDTVRDLTPAFGRNIQRHVEGAFVRGD